MKIKLQTLLLVILTLPFFISGCASLKTPDSSKVCHIVLCWLNDPGNEDDKSNIIDAAYKFKDIPGVVSVKAGESMPSDRPVADSSFDVAIMIFLEDEKALQNYLINPDHKSAQKYVLMPLVRKIVIYDFYME